MRKRIPKIFIMILLLLILPLKIKTNAKSITQIHLVFNKVTYAQNEEVKLTINLENFQNLNETRVIIKCNENKLKPILKNNNYGQLVNNSIYEEALLNDYAIGGYLRFHLLKKNLDSGYYSGFKNNIGEFYFQAKESISNIYNYFQIGNFGELDCGINITLYDIYNQEIETEINYSEKINIEWSVEKYIVEVNTSLPDYLKDLKIDNRNEYEYEVVYNPIVDIYSLGTKVINLVIYDKISSDYIFLSKPVEVLDTTAPVICGESMINIISTELDKFDLHPYYQIEDNYDLSLDIVIKYYQENKKELNSWIDLISYLKSNEYGKVTIEAIDSSNNKSEIFTIELLIKDITPPSLNHIEKYEVLDKDVKIFNFETLVEIVDDYDLTPKLIYNGYINDEIINIVDCLNKGINFEIEYYAIDKSDNQSQKFYCNIIIVDTTAPIINSLTSLEIKDYEVSSLKVSSLISISDNIDQNPQIIIEYYIEEKLYQYTEWLKELSKGKEGYFTYYGIDKSKNKTTEVKVIVKIIDTTAPIINIKNIKNGQKYTPFTPNIEITDNFYEGLTYECYLNDTLYEGEKISKPNNYILVVTAIDKAGNKTTTTVEFEVIKNNIIGCGDDMECYKDNYLDVVIIACLLMVATLTIIIIKLFKYRKKKKIVKSDEE